MEKFVSLADTLGVQDPIHTERPLIDEPPTFVSVKDFCRMILRSREYRESLMRRIVVDELPPQIETMLWDRAEGKVASRLEVDDVTNRFEHLTAEQLETRASVLLEFARTLRRTDDILDTSGGEPDDTPKSVVH